MISLAGIKKSFDAGRTFAVDALSLDIPANAITVFVGESGSGKTTSLKMLNRLVEPDSGVITLQGEDLRNLDPVQLRRRMGYVFQGIGLFPHMSIAANVGLVPDLLEWPAEERHARIGEVMELVGLPAAEYGPRFPAELSGGQQQRAGVARALAARAEILLMDEPFGALDPLTRAELQGELVRLKDLLGLTIVMVTHDMTEALLLADQIVVLRNGCLVASGRPAELMRQSDHAYVTELLATPRRQADAIERLARAAE